MINNSSSFNKRNHNGDGVWTSDLNSDFFMILFLRFPLSWEGISKTNLLSELNDLLYHVRQRDNPDCKLNNLGFLQNHTLMTIKNNNLNTTTIDFIRAHTFCASRVQFKRAARELEVTLTQSTTRFLSRDSWRGRSPSQLSGVSINLLAFYHECCPLIGYATHVLFNK